MSEEVKKCSLCKVPYFAYKEHQWNKNGTWGTKGGHRIAYFPVGLWSFLFDEMEKRTGVSFKKLILGSKISSTSAYVDSVLVGIKGFLLRNRLMHKVAFEKVKEDAKFHGFGTYTIIKADYQKDVIISARNVYVDVLLAGDLGGTFKSLYKKWPKVEWRREDDKLTITAVAIEKEKSSFIEAVSVPPPKTLSGGKEHERCSKCGTPLELTRTFEWEWADGLLIEKSTRKRWCGSGVITRSIFSTIAKELGKDISSLMVDIVKDYFCKEISLCLKNDNQYKELFESFRVKGWGNVVKIENKGEVLSVRIDSPYDESILAGIVGGYYEAIEGKKAQTEWTLNKSGYVLIKVQPKQ